MNGGMAEAESGCVTLEDEDKDTFDRFAQWLYTAKYKATQSSQDDNVSSSFVKNPKTKAGLRFKKSSKSVRTRNGVIAKKLSRTPIRKAPRQSLPEAKPPLKSFRKPRTDLENLPFLCFNRSANEVYSEVFLSHARLYVFADKYDIPALKALSLRKLESSLREFAKLSQSR